MPTVSIEVEGGVFNSELEHISDNLLLDTDSHRIIGLNTTLPSYSKKIRIEGYVFPGFIDAHMHLTGTGLKLLGVDLSKARNPRDIGLLLRRAKGSIAYGRGWDQESFETEGELPNRALLDQYVNDRPAIGVRVCGHMAVVNTKALFVTEVHKKYPELVDVEKGLLIEDAVEYAVNKLLETMSVEQYIKAAADALINAGIAGVSSMSCSPKEYYTLLELSRKNNLQLHVACYPDYGKVESIKQEPDPRVSIAGVKLYADGSFGAHTAALKEPYNDEGGIGKLLLTRRDIIEIASRYTKSGLRIATHAIGDLAIDEVLSAYETLGIGSNGRIEHFSISTDEYIDRASSLGVHVVVQPYFRIGDWWLPKRIGDDRVLLSYRFKTMIKRGVKLALSTDSPVDPYHPWETLRAVYSECDTVLCRQEEALSPREAFKSYTVLAAEASGGTVTSLGEIRENASINTIAWTPNDPTQKEWRGPAKLLLLLLRGELL
jgi:predicted amidohydrolase YtcJ